MHITCTSHAHHTTDTRMRKHVTCTSHAHHMHITQQTQGCASTSHAHHMHITCTSHAHHKTDTTQLLTENSPGSCSRKQKSESTIESKEESNEEREMKQLKPEEVVGASLPPLEQHYVYIHTNQERRQLMENDHTKCCTEPRDARDIDGLTDVRYEQLADVRNHTQYKCCVSWPQTAKKRWMPSDTQSGFGVCV